MVFYNLDTIFDGMYSKVCYGDFKVFYGFLAVAVECLYSMCVCVCVFELWSFAVLRGSGIFRNKFEESCDENARGSQNHADEDVPQKAAIAALQLLV